MTLNDNFNHSHKTASTHLQLLGKRKNFTTVKARYAICTFMIIPLLIYSCPIQSTFTNTQLDSFSSIDGLSFFIIFFYRAKAMLPNESQPTSIHNYLKNECVNLVQKCLNKQFASDIFDNYFEMIDHSMNARNNKLSMRLPPAKVDVARHGLYFTGGYSLQQLTN